MSNPINPIQKVTPFIWFDANGEKAMNFYVSVFVDSEIVSLNRNEDGKMFTGKFRIGAQEFMVLNGGPYYTPSPGISFFVNCKTQEEVDHFWDKLAEGGKTMQCGWLTDKFGVTWQIIPDALGDLLGKDESGRVMAAMMKMIKIDIAGLQKAFDEN